MIGLVARARHGGELGGRHRLLEMGADRCRSIGARGLAGGGRLGRHDRRPRAGRRVIASVAGPSTRAGGAGVCRGLSGSAIAYLLWFEIVRRLPAMTASLGVSERSRHRRRGLHACARRAADPPRRFRVYPHPGALPPACCLQEPVIGRASHKRAGPPGHRRVATKRRAILPAHRTGGGTPGECLCVTARTDGELSWHGSI